MSAGEQQARLQHALQGVQLDRVRLAALDWHDGAKILRDVAAALEKCSPDIRENFGGSTGPAAQAAFDTVHARVQARAQEMTAAGEALDVAGDVIHDGQEKAAALAAGAPTEPTMGPPQLDDTPRDVLRREAAYGQQMADYAAEVDARERAARRMANRMDEVFVGSTETFRAIHGDQHDTQGVYAGTDKGPGGRHHGGPHDAHIVKHEPRPPRHPEVPEPVVCTITPPPPPPPPTVCPPETPTTTPPPTPPLPPPPPPPPTGPETTVSSPLGPGPTGLGGHGQPGHPGSASPAAGGAAGGVSPAALGGLAAGAVGGLAGR
ncbi:hypothetical protein, partial [Nocardioides lijunqiniae]|uniref:hypothetical protein n=1 Tax=Nocardioides lijunqiniae TaxID=2760832 RepID=UPI001D0BFAA0